MSTSDGCSPAPVVHAPADGTAMPAVCRPTMQPPCMALVGPARWRGPTRRTLNAGSPFEGAAMAGSPPILSRLAGRTGRGAGPLPRRDDGRLPGRRGARRRRPAGHRSRGRRFRGARGRRRPAARLVRSQQRGRRSDGRRPPPRTGVAGLRVERRALARAAAVDLRDRVPPAHDRAARYGRPRPRTPWSIVWRRATTAASTSSTRS